MNQASPQKRSINLGFRFPNEARTLFDLGTLEADALRRAVLSADEKINSPEGRDQRHRTVRTEGVLYEALYGPIIFADCVCTEAEHGWIDDDKTRSLLLMIAQSLETDPSIPYAEHTRREFIEVMKRKGVLSDNAILIAGYPHFLVERSDAPDHDMI